jgi:MYXO-CTERM domain-containing protein
MRSSDDKRRPHRSLASRPRLGPCVATGAALTLGVSVAGASVAEALPVAPSSSLHAAAHAAPEGVRELLVVDARVPHRELLVAGARRGVEVLLLDADRDGITQIAAATEGRDFGAIHLVAHGSAGEVHIGSSVLDAEVAAERRDAIGGWFAARAPYEARPELLVYACEAASGVQGLALLDALARAARADVAASHDRTGGSGIGANWVLEAATAPIEASLPIASWAARGYPATLETFQVTTDASAGEGSFAQAIADANANANPEETDIIQFGSVTGTIVADDTFEITEPLSIEGTGAATLAIDGGEAVRVFDATADLALAGLTIRGGFAPEGGGAIRVTGAALLLDDSVLRGNASASNGGAVAAYDASVVVAGTTFADGEAASGGALFVSSSSLDVESSSFEDNRASAEGGAIAIDSSTAFIHDSLFAGNQASSGGGAIHAGHDGGGPPLVSIGNSTISGNSAPAGGGIAATGNAYTELVHVTVTENTISGGMGGGCFAAGVDGCGLVGAGIVLVESSILAGNLDGSEAGVDLGGDALDLELEVRSSLVGLLEGGVATAGEPIFGEDPLLGPLADNGGTTRTHALLTGSPAIDRGENIGALAYDQRGRGFPRVIGAAADMGAYEWSEDDENGGGDGDGSIGDGGLISDPKGAGGDDGCGCSVPGSGAGSAPPAGGVAAALLGVLAAWRRRGRRR